MNNEKTGRFIRIIRQEKGLTQKEIAEELHITDRAVSKWERGLCAPDISLLEPLARILGVTIGELIAGEKIDLPIQASIEEATLEVIDYSKEEIMRKDKGMKRKVVVACIIACIAVLFSVISMWSPVIFQKGNPIPYLLAATQLNDETAFVQVKSTDSSDIYITRNGKQESFLNYIADCKGLQFQEQVGSAFIFANGIDKLVVTSEVYWGSYTVWKVPDITLASSGAEEDKHDYPPMVRFNDTLYVATNYDTNNLTLNVVGEVDSFIEYGIPTMNNQANDEMVGCKIYASESIPDIIFVLYNGQYSPYKIDTNFN